jgi:TRAP-type C4-dicarboxylate transport system permease small subunit
MPDATEREQDGAQGAALPQTLVERAAGLACEIVLVAMVLLISVEVVARQFHYSLEVVDELGGYLLAALTFLSLPVALIGGAFHQVEYVQRRLGTRGRAATGLVFTSLSLTFCLLLAWQLWRLVTRSYASNVFAPTVLGTPLWIPQSAMLLGVAALIFALLRVLARQARGLARQPERRDG